MHPCKSPLFVFWYVPLFPFPVLNYFDGQNSLPVLPYIPTYCCDICITCILHHLVADFTVACIQSYSRLFLLHHLCWRIILFNKTLVAKKPGLVWTGPEASCCSIMKCFERLVTSHIKSILPLTHPVCIPSQTIHRGCNLLCPPPSRHPPGQKRLMWECCS